MHIRTLFSRSDTILTIKWVKCKCFWDVFVPFCARPVVYLSYVVVFIDLNDELGFKKISLCSVFLLVKRKIPNVEGGV